MSTLKLLASKNFITINRTLMLELGIDEAIMIGELASEYDYWESNERLDEDGFFYSTVENVEENTTLTKYKQKKALDNLQKLGLVEVKRKGLPAKRYIKINEKKITEILSNKKSKNLTSGSKKISQQQVKEFDLNNNKYNNNKDNKVSKEVSKPKKSKQCSPRKTYDEIIDEYTDNEELKLELKAFLQVVKLKNMTLTNRALELLLADLDELAATDYHKRRIIQKSLVNGWTSFEALSEEEENEVFRQHQIEEKYGTDFFKKYSNSD